MQLDEAFQGGRAWVCFGVDGGAWCQRRRNLDRGFILSDHADWAGLLEVVKGTGAEDIKLTHGDGAPLARYLGEQGIHASMLEGSYQRTEEE